MEFSSTDAEADLTCMADPAWQLERETAPCLEVTRFVVPGDPVSKARARFSGKGAFTPERTVEAERIVGWHARAAGLRGQPDASSNFGLLCVFFTADWRRRDADNMLKLVGDALNKIAYADDSQLTEIAGRIVHADPSPRTHVLLYRTLGQRQQRAARLR
jgi:Holliday junction resolvase RusA-like endonuclease